MVKKLFLMLVICLLFLIVSSGELILVVAQTSSEEYQKKLDRDKSVPKEKVEKAFEEAKKIQESVLALVSEKKSGYKLSRKYSRHLINDNPGERGTTGDELTWKTPKTQIGITIRLGVNKEQELDSFHFRLNRISMGDFYKMPNIGDEAILVKNVTTNQIDTSVGLHFVKGRAQVDIYLTNHKRSTEKNEKELLEFARLIEPLIIARANFDDD